MIIYSLWLLKKWQDGVAYLPSVSFLPRPWFIYTCLGVGIAVCLSTLSGCMVANCISNYTLCIYVVSICSLLFLEVAVLVTIFFKMDWAEELAKYIDEKHTEFKTFVFFHIKMCRSILIMILVPQLCVIVLAIILWAIGTEPRTQEVAVLVTIFFKMDWAEELAKYIDEKHTEFKTFVFFHIKMCRSILIMILVPQLCVIVLAIILWAIGTEPRTQGGYLNISDFNHSFLVTPNSPSVLSVSVQVCPKCEVFYRTNPHQSFLSYVKGLLRMQFQGRIIDSY
nr:tetraspanin-19 [Quercus suber]